MTVGELKNLINNEFDLSDDTPIVFSTDEYCGTLVSLDEDASVENITMDKEGKPVIAKSRGQEVLVLYGV